MKWRHGDSTPCTLPPSQSDIGENPNAFTRYVFGLMTAECGHGTTVFCTGEDGE